MLPYSTKYSPLPPPHTPTRPLKHGWYSPGRPDSPDEEESPASDGESSEGDPRETIVLAAAGEVVADEGSEGHAQESSAGMAVDQRVEDGLNVEANTNADFGGCMFHSFGVWEDEHRRQAVEDMISARDGVSDCPLVWAEWMSHLVADISIRELLLVARRNNKGEPPEEGTLMWYVWLWGDMITSHGVTRQEGVPKLVTADFVLSASGKVVDLEAPLGLFILIISTKRSDPEDPVTREQTPSERSNPTPSPLPPPMPCKRKRKAVGPIPRTCFIGTQACTLPCLTRFQRLCDHFRAWPAHELEIKEKTRPAYMSLCEKVSEDPLEASTTPGQAELIRIETQQADRP